jgi:predicted nuclease with TOPRIM domain
MSNWRAAKAVVTVVKKITRSDQLNNGLGATAGNSSPAPVAAGERGDAKETEKVYDMPMDGNDGATGSALPAHHPNTNISDLLQSPPAPNNATSHGAADPNREPRRTNSGKNPDNSHSTRGNGAPRPRSQAVAGDEEHITLLYDSKPMTFVTSSAQEIESPQDPFLECSDDHGNNHLRDTEKEEEEEEVARPHLAAISSPEYKALERKYAILEQGRQALERRYTDLVASHKIIQDKFTHLTKENESLAQDKERLQSEIQPLKEQKELLSAKYQNLLTVNADLGDERETWKAQHTSLAESHEKEKLNITALRTELETTGGELEKIKILNAEIMKSKAETERRNNELDSSLEAVRGELKTIQEDCKKLWKRNSKLTAQLSGYTFEGSVYAADAYFQQEWRNLDAKIMNWSYTNFGTNSQTFFGAILNRTPKLRESHVLRRVATDPNRYLTDLDRRPAFVQSLVWSVLVSRVFIPPGGWANSDYYGLCWSGPLRNELDIISGSLYPSKTPEYLR